MGERKFGFSLEEARIRDLYDRFLDGLGRFENFREYGLFSRRKFRKKLDPYLRYWIEDIAAYTESPDDAAWTCALMVYIEFYDFSNVQRLFMEYGYDISTSGEVFKKQSDKVLDREWLGKVLEECEKKRQNSGA